MWDSCTLIKFVSIGILDAMYSKKCGRKSTPIQKKSHYFYNLFSQTECPPLEITFEYEANHNIPKLDFDPSIPYHSILLN